MNAEAIRSPVSYLPLSGSEKVEQGLAKYVGSIPLTPTTADTGDLATSKAAEAAFAFSVTYLPELTGDHLSSLFEVRSCTFPPLVVLTNGKISGRRQEKLRQAGVALILPIDNASKSDQARLEMLCQSDDWFKSRLSRAALPDILQMLAVRHRTGMISVSCPHNPTLGPDGLEQRPASLPGWKMPGLVRKAVPQRRPPALRRDAYQHGGGGPFPFDGTRRRNAPSP